jgi:hypothetical protein
VKAFTTAYEKIPTAEQKLLVLHSWLNKSRNEEPVAVALEQVIMRQNVNVLPNLKSIWAKADAPERRNTADSITLKRTICLAISPNTGTMDRRQLRNLANVLGVTERRCGFFKFMRDSATKRSLIIVSNGREPRIIQHHNRKKKSRFSPELIRQLEDWLLTECNLIVASPNAKDSFQVLDAETGLKVRKQKHFYLTSVRDIHNQMVANFPAAKNYQGKVLISDTMLRQLMPRNLSRMTDSHKEMCGCEPCIITKLFLQTIVSWTRKYVTHLKENAAGWYRSTTEQDECILF